MFATVDVDVDSDGETLVLEFPEGQEFQMELANDDDNRALLRGALAAAMGAAPPFRYQLGRGKVRPAEDAKPAPAPAHRDPEFVAAPAAVTEPADAPEFDDSTRERVAKSGHDEPDDDAPVDDIDRLLSEQFGAKVVAEEIRQADREDES